MGSRSSGTCASLGSSSAQSGRYPKTSAPFTVLIVHRPGVLNGMGWSARAWFVDHWGKMDGFAYVVAYDDDE